MVANVLRHERFQGVPVQPQKRRRGPLPRGVVSIKRTPRLHIGVVAEIVGSRDSPENNGIRVLIMEYDPQQRPHCWLTKSLGPPIRCNDGALDKDVWFKDCQLRRVWTGLSENERIQLRLRRGVP